MGLEDSKYQPVRNTLKDTETVCLLPSGEIQHGTNPEYGYPYAQADTFIIGKNGPELEAWGGDCAVISMLDRKQNLGCLIHNGAADIGTNRHRELLAILMEVHNSVSKNTEIHICLDEECVDPESGEKWEDIERLRGEWLEDIIAALRERGFENIEIVSHDKGKDVRLDTRSGLLRVFNDEQRLIFEKK